MLRIVSCYVSFLGSHGCNVNKKDAGPSVIKCVLYVIIRYWFNLRDIPPTVVEFFADSAETKCVYEAYSSQEGGLTGKNLSLSDELPYR